MARRISFFLTLLIFLVSCVPARDVPTPSSTLAKSTETPFITLEPTLTPFHPTPTPDPSPDAFTATRALGRGVNMGNALEAPNEGEWDVVIQEEYFDLIKEAGFDFVRLPVNWKAHTKHTGYDDGDSSYTIDPAFFARVDEVVKWALKRDLPVILDFHNYEELSTEPNEEQFLFLWEQIAEHYKDYPPQVLFELANEPHDQMTAALWNIYILDGLKVIRQTNPTRDVVIGPVNSNAYDWVTTLDIPGDPHFIVTFHYYEPFSFTHQGADWVNGSNNWIGEIWPNNDERKREVIRHFDLVADWAQRHKVRILLGEFGAYSKADMDSRSRWTAFIAREAEKRGFAWAYWEFCAGFGVYDPENKQWRGPLLKALIP